MAKNNSRKPRAERHNDAENRKEVHASRSNEEQIAELNRRLGEGVGAKKERNRLRP
jgi:hypothetical protein